MDLFRLRVDDDIVLQLRLESDSQAFFALVDRNRMAFRRVMPWVDETQTVDDEQSYIDDCRKDFESRKSLDLGIMYHKAWVGSIGLQDIDRKNHSSELGYWLVPEVQGMRIMSRSVRALVKHGFEQYGLHRIWARIAPHNFASQRVAISSGFTYESKRKQSAFVNGAYEDELIYRILKPEWREHLRVTA